jgi:hypothetical protein
LGGNNNVCFCKSQKRRKNRREDFLFFGNMERKEVSVQDANRDKHLHVLPHPDYGIRSTSDLFTAKLAAQLALCNEAIANSHLTDDKLKEIADEKQRQRAQEERLLVEKKAMDFFALDVEALALSPAGKKLLMDYAAADTKEIKDRILDQIKIHLGAIELEIEKNRKQLSDINPSDTNETLFIIRTKEWGINPQSSEARLH